MFYRKAPVILRGFFYAGIFKVGIRLFNVNLPVFRLLLGYIGYLTGNLINMAKEKSPQKNEKKKAEKNLKEKRADKKAKKESKKRQD